MESVGLEQACLERAGDGLESAGLDLLRFCLESFGLEKACLGRVVGSESC